MPLNPAIVSFNPTARALQYDGKNLDDVIAMVSAVGVQSLPDLKAGTYVVVFMGQVTLMGEDAYRSALGLG